MPEEEKRAGNSYYLPQNLRDRLEPLRDKVEAPYRAKGEERDITLADIIAFLLRHYTHTEYYSRNSAVLEQVNEKVRIITVEYAEKTKRDRAMIKKHIESIRFNGGQSIKLDYSRVPGLDQFVDDPDMDAIREAKAK